MLDKPHDAPLFSHRISSTLFWGTVWESICRKRFSLLSSTRPCACPVGSKSFHKNSPCPKRIWPFPAPIFPVAPHLYECRRKNLLANPQRLDKSMDNVDQTRIRTSIYCLSHMFVPFCMSKDVFTVNPARWHLHGLCASCIGHRFAKLIVTTETLQPTRKCMGTCWNVKFP